MSVSIPSGGVSVVYRDETDNDMDGWLNENGTLPSGWYRINDATASGPYGSEEEATLTALPAV